MSERGWRQTGTGKGLADKVRQLAPLFISIRHVPCREQMKCTDLARHKLTDGALTPVSCSAAKLSF